METAKLNPIQQKIANGMTAIAAYLTEATCGENCWTAREDTCHCSCGGRNHGCMRSPDGVRPERTAKIQGYRYVLKATGYEGLHDAAVKFNEAHGVTFIYAYSSRDRSDANVPAKIRPASESQVENWPELSAYRENLPDTWRKANPDKCGAYWPGLPSLLWIREDLVTEFK